MRIPRLQSQELADLFTPHRIALGIAFLWILFAALTYQSYGLTSDSPSLFYAGDRHLFWLLHPFTKDALNFFAADPPAFHTTFFRFPEQADPFHYPVFPGFVAAVASAILSDVLHLMSPLDGHQFGLALLQAVNLYVFARYAMSLFGRVAGAGAALMLALFPCILGHAINNAKDLPCTVIYGTVLMAGARGFARRSWRDLLACGFWAGVGLDCKLNAVFALITFAIWTPVAYATWLRGPECDRRWVMRFLGLSYGLPLGVLLASFLLGWEVTPTQAAMGLSILIPTAMEVVRRRGEPSRRLVAAYVAIPLVAVITFVALWPWLWAGSGSTFWERVYLYGVGMVRFSSSPRPGFTDYPLRSVIYMTPPLVLALAAVGVGLGWRGGPARRALYAMTVLWLAVPLGRISVPHSMFYDANRHFLEYAPAVCMLAGIGLGVVVDWLVRLADRWLRIASLAALAGSLAAALAMPIAGYHPYEVTYFNWLAGGLGGAQRQALMYVPGEDWREPGTEGDYWHSSIRDFLSYVGSVVPPEAQICTCGTMYVQAIANWSGPPLRYVERRDDADYVYVAPREGFCSWADIRDLESQRPVLLRIQRDRGLIYEILGPEVSYPLPSVSARTSYDLPLVLLPST